MKNSKTVTKKDADKVIAMLNTDLKKAELFSKDGKKVVTKKETTKKATAKVVTKKEATKKKVTPKKATAKETKKADKKELLIISNKGNVYLSWKDGLTDSKKLLKKTDGKVQEKTIKLWLNKWAKGYGLPAIAKN